VLRLVVLKLGSMPSLHIFNGLCELGTGGFHLLSMASILGLLFIKSFLSGGLMSLLVSFSLFDQLVQSVSVTRL